MKKNLFLAGALALFSIVGVSAQQWCRTLATGTAGEQITHKVGDADVTQHRAQTALIKNAGAKGVRYTVFQTGATNQIKGGGPCFALAEMIVLDADGDTIKYTVDSNADHNTMGGAGNDGEGMPALNDGNLNNYFHSTWSAAAPNEYHYIELTFEKTVDEYQLVWYTRPNQHQNRPLVIGLTNPGITFGEDMLFAEYEFELGDKVVAADELKAGTFAFYVTGPEEYSNNGETTEGRGNVFVALSGHDVGNYTAASPQNIVQFIPTDKEGEFILYQPILDTYYADPDFWTDGYNGKNGWLRAYNEPRTLAKFEFTKRADGDFEITTYLDRQYVDGEFVDFENPLKVWVGYDMRGSLKIFPENVKKGLESGDYSLGFGLPVDFGFTIYKTDVNKELVPDKTAKEMCAELLAKPLATANEKLEEYAEYATTYAGYYEMFVAADKRLDAVIGQVGAVLENANLAEAFEMKAKLENAVAAYVATKAFYYQQVYAELLAKYEANKVGSSVTSADEGKYTAKAGELLEQANALCMGVMGGYQAAEFTKTAAQIEADYATIESLFEQFELAVVHFSTFPEVVSDIPVTMSQNYPNNAVWGKSVYLTEPVKGIRLTFLDRHIGTAGDGGNFPMIALGEFVLTNGGDTVKLTADNFYANHTETNEGFESTVARLCDGNYGAQGYYHSPWSGSEPQEYIYLDVTFPEAMSEFTFEVYSRDKSTSNGQVSLFPKKVAVTNVGEAYDPLLFAENPYNVTVGEQVTKVADLTDGLYVVKGLLNTNAVYKENEETGEIEMTDATGTSMFYKGIGRFHNSPAAVRAESVYRITKNADGTYKFLNLGTAKYWPTTEGEAGERTGFLTATYLDSEAAALNVVASGHLDNTFVIYEKVEGLTTQTDSIDNNEDGIYDEAGAVYPTPYVVYMDWHDGLAARPVVEPKPFVDEEYSDGWGDAMCFNKANGEGEWEIYKVTMDNPDYYWLTGLVGIVDGLGIVVGEDPGCVSDLGALEKVLPEAQKVIADSAYDKAAAAAAALAAQIAAVEGLEKNPMVPGVYQVVSAYEDYFAKQGKEKALYATVDEAGTMTFGWKDLEEGNIQFYFDFQKSDNAKNLVESGTIAEENGGLVYNIRAIATYDEYATPYYIGQADGQSVAIDLFGDAASDYLVLNAKGSAFNLQYPGQTEWNIHCGGHGSGSGQSGTIVYWTADPGASQWYLRKVDYETSISDLVVEGDEVVSVAYFTPAGAAIPAPAQGINIVVTVYANGVVETKKVLVK